MRPTAEIRWFQEGSIPEVAGTWFRQLGPEMKVADPRTDRYLLPTDEELNVKLREGNIEVKRRDQPGTEVVPHPHVTGLLECWRKWSWPIAKPAEDVSSDLWVQVRKTRWLRTYRLDADGAVQPAPAEALLTDGCMTELSTVEAFGKTWWSICFEAFGEEHRVEEYLMQTARHVFSRGTPPRLDAVLSVGYPAWMLAVATEVPS